MSEIKSKTLEELIAEAEEKVMNAYLRVAETSEITLNEQQLEAVIGAALAIEKKEVEYIIHGLAGTGKTVVLAFLSKMYPDSFVVAPTGKAAMVLTTKMGRVADTIHSLFYRLVDEETKDGRRNLIFKFMPKISYNSQVLLDECSMADVEQRHDILRTKATVIAVGDPGQLRPVGREPGFPKPNYVLTEIQRQALNSPIITQAHRVRQGYNYIDEGHPDFRVIKGLTNLSDKDLLAADIVLCWRNVTVGEMNKRIRKLKYGYTDEYAHKGEPVMCLRNWREMGIQNGGIYECTEAYNPTKKTIGIRVDGENMKLKHCDWNVQPKGNMKTAMMLGHCCTTNKSQGSEWDKVILIDDYTMKDDRSLWTYTGITRAAKSIIVVDDRWSKK